MTANIVDIIVSFMPVSVVVALCGVIWVCDELKNRKKGKEVL